jgi:serine/threonine protein kinase
MATIHVARLTGAEGFSRIVAAKRLHPEFIEDQEFVTMFLDEARIASKVHHPNVVPVLDVVTTGAEIVLVQEYVHGVPFNVLLKEVRKRKARVPLPIAVSIVAGALEGLHAAHEAKDELGNALQIVHRDVSPHNVIVSVEGTPRLLDFGVAKATLSAHVPREGTFKGKIAYTAPEQLMGKTSLASDIYSAGVMLWEAIVGRRMHEGTPEQAVLTAVMKGDIPTITEALKDAREGISDAEWQHILLLEPILIIALALDPADRFHTAADFERAIVDVVPRVPRAKSRHGSRTSAAGTSRADDGSSPRTRRAGAST